MKEANSEPEGRATDARSEIFIKPYAIYPNEGVDDKSHPLGNLRRRETSDKSGYKSEEYSDLNKAFDAWLASIPNKATRKSYEPFVLRFLKRIGNKPLNRVTLDDCIGYVNSHESWHSRHMSLASLRSFLDFTLERPPKLHRVKLGDKPEPKPITEPTEEEMAKLWGTINSLRLVEQVALRLTIETGHRRHAVMALPRSAIQLRPNGPVVVFPPMNEKKRTSSVAPISRRTYELVQQLLNNHDDELVMPYGMVWRFRDKWLYELVKRVAKAAGLGVNLYPHLFRHLKALEFRRNGTKEDTILNTLGWRDNKMFNERYGRRQQFETCEEARTLLKESQEVVTPKPAAKSRDQLIIETMELIKTGKIDAATAQVLLSTINKTDTKAGELAGYG